MMDFKKHQVITYKLKTLNMQTIYIIGMMNSINYLIKVYKSKHYNNNMIKSMKQMKYGILLIIKNKQKKYCQILEKILIVNNYQKR